jgi:hypothetical protein
MAIFGDGLDLNIACCGDINKSSYSNLGYSYELPDGIKQNTDKARSFLAGSISFLIQEIEVFRVNF